MRRTLCILLIAALAACSKEKEINPPAELTEFESTLNVERVWSAGVGGSEDPLRLGLGLGIEGDRVYAAGSGGEVAAFDLNTGRAIWRARTRVRLSGGTGASSDVVAVGSSEGDVIALNASDGSVRWHVDVNGEVLSAPAVGAEAVVVRTVDGRLRGLSLQDGRELWQLQQAVPRLSLRGTSRPTINDGVAICGFDNGKVLAVNASDGALMWESTVSAPRGRTELERLVDVDSAARVSDNDVYAVTYQGRVAMLQRDTGQVWWSHEASSYRGLGVDDEQVYMSNAAGEVVAMQRRTGTEAWRQNALSNRGISAPAVSDFAVTVADFQGYVHWLDKTTGALAARTSAGGTRVTNPPVAVGNMLLVMNDEGRITAFRATPKGK